MEIIDFNARKEAIEKLGVESKDSPNIDVKPKDYKGCRHKRRIVDAELRTVHCRNCGEQLDPIQVLIEISQTCGEWKVPQLEAQIKYYSSIYAAMQRKVDFELMTAEERKMTLWEIQADHLKNGCPRERMYFKKNMVRCVCGSGHNIDSFPKIALEVREAHERLKRLKLVSPEGREL